MTGESDLARLLRGMRPVIGGRDWGFASSTAGVPRGISPLALIAEDEGLTIVAPMAALAGAGLAAQGPLARITLTIHSSLDAVGLTAAVAGALAAQGISANVLAGYYHDHILVAAPDADRALAILQGLSDG